MIPDSVKVDPAALADLRVSFADLRYELERFVQHLATDLVYLVVQALLACPEFRAVCVAREHACSRGRPSSFDEFRAMVESGLLNN